MAFRLFLFKYSHPIVIGTLVSGWVGSLAASQPLAEYLLWRSSLFDSVDGEKFQLDDQALQLFKETKAQMQSQVSCEPFIAGRCDPFVIGSFCGTTFLGFPFNINYRAASDMPVQSLRFGRENLLLASDDPRRGEITASLVLSEDAKRFLFARQVTYAESQHCLVTSSVTAACAYLAFLSSYVVNRTIFADPRRFPRLTRVIAYLVFGSCAFFLRLSILSLYAHRLDAKADQRAMALGPEFARGGQQFYEGLVRRNLLYRSLFKSDAEADSYFTRLGNECPGTFSVSGMLVRERLALVQKAQRQKT